MAHAIGSIAERVDPVSPQTPCLRVFERFEADSCLHALPVVAGDGRPAGIVPRERFLQRFLAGYGRDLYGARPIALLMDASPCVVEAATDISAASAHILERRRDALRVGFLIAHDGLYEGVGSSVALLRRSLEIARAHADEIDRERLAAERANHAKSQFLANMSHELRTPLNAVIGFSDIMTAEMFGPLGAAKYRSYVADINASARHLLALINDLLDMSKIEAGHMEIAESNFALEEALAEAVRMVAPQADAGGLALIREAAPEIHLTADRRMLDQMLLNLLSNAVKFTPQGGRVTLGARALPCGGAAIAVRDTGIGIPEDQIGRVLEPFHQVENAMSRTKPGTGLGLSLVRAMIELHGGRIALTSRAGQGTSVELYLPPARVMHAPSALAG